jgi:hypothetical protein
LLRAAAAAVGVVVVVVIVERWAAVVVLRPSLRWVAATAAVGDGHVARGPRESPVSNP